MRGMSDKHTKARMAALDGSYAKIEVRYVFPDGSTDTETMSGSARNAAASAIRRIQAKGVGAKAYVVAFKPADPRGRFPASQVDIWKGVVESDGRAYERGGGFSRPGAKARMQKEYVLWGIPKGKTSALDEQVLSTQAKTPAQMDAIKKRAAADGWHSFRVQILDLSKPYKGFGFSRPGAKATMQKYRINATVEIDYRGETVKGKISSLVSSSPETYMIDIPSKSVRVKRTLEQIKKHIPTTDWLGIAMSRPGAKARMGGMRDTKGRGPFHLRYIASGLYGEPTWKLIDKAGKTVAYEYNEQSAQEMLRKANAGEPVYVSSRPGAKARMALNPIFKHEILAEYNSVRRAAVEKGVSKALPILDKHLAKIKSGSASDKDWLNAQDAMSGNGGIIDTFPELFRFSRPGAKVKAGRAEDLYRKLSSGSITYANAKEWERLVTEALRLPDYTPPGGDMSLHEIAEDLGGDLMALKTHSGPVPHAKAKAEKPSDLEREDVKAGLKLMEKADPAVSDKIRTLIKEGKPQDQAVAIALDMKRRGEL